MTSFLPKLEETLAELLQYGDTGMLAVEDEDRTWGFFVQSGALVGVRGGSTPAGEEEDPEQRAIRYLVEAMQAGSPLLEFRPDEAPEEFGFFDARRLVTIAVSEARPVADLLDRLRPVLEGWPELRVDPEAYTDQPAMKQWLGDFNGLATGSARLARTPTDEAAYGLAAIWLAWRLGDLEVHGQELVDDAGESNLPGDDASAPEPVDLQELAEDPHTLPSVTNQTERTATSAHGRSTSASVKSVDPYLRGLSLARADQTAAALPLLEEAFADDPDHPGLEEWLGFCRFTVLRDSDPARAQSGLEMLRDVMYRTGPTGEMPLLPWTLMARAQFERGDLVQSRSILNSILERDRNDTEARQLEARLARAEAEQEAARVRPTGPVYWPRVVVLFGLLFAALATYHFTVWVQGSPPIRVDLAPAVAHIAPLRELHRLEGGFVGVTAAGSPADASPPQALAVCQLLAAELYPTEGETITLVSDAGALLAECGERLR